MPCLLVALVLSLQSPDSAATVTAVRTARPPVIDGAVNDDVWQAATPMTRFVQENPREGAPASEPTEIRVLYDDGALYVAARMTQRTSTIRGLLTRRDATSPSDLFSVALDTYHDHQTAMVFTVNPAGVRMDGLASADHGDIDASPDPVWEAATRIDSLGWTAEIRIPLSQLRFSARPEQIWGINMFRSITSANETDAFVLVKQNEQGYASRFGHLVGIRDVPSPKRLELLPYARTQLESRPATPGDPFFRGRELRHAGGADLKYGLTSNVTLDATVNPDFGQVEADPAQLNLTVFETFFEERRPFFVEGSQIFAFGRTAGFSLSPGNVFYSRRIGRAPTLEPNLGLAYAAGDSVMGPFTDVPKNSRILGAGKVSGKLARGTSFGVLHAETGRATGTIEATQLFGRRVAVAGVDSALVVDRREVVRYEDELEPRAHYSVARLRQDFRGGQTTAGLIYTRVARDLDTPRLDSLFRRGARTAGFDWQHRWARNRFNFTGDAEWTSIDGSTYAMLLAQRSSARYFQRPDQTYLRLDPARTSLTGSSSTASLTYDAPSGWGFRLAGNSTSPGYELNDVGFLSQSDTRVLFGRVSYGTPKPSTRFRRVATEVSVSETWNYGGERLPDHFQWNVVATTQQNWTYFAGVGAGNAGMSAVATRGGPAIKSSPNASLFATVASDSRKPLSGSADLFFYRTELGTRVRSYSLSARWRPALNAEFSFGPSYSYQREVGYLVAKVPDTLASATYGARYVFGPQTQRTLSLSARANITFTPSLSLQSYVEPFTSGATSSDFRELLRVRTHDLNVYATDQNVSVQRDTAGNYGVAISRNGTVATRFTIPNPDVRFRSLRGTAVLRWEYRPGATVFAVWSHNRGAFEPGAVYRGLADVRSLLSLPLENVLLVKVNYWTSK
jgi:hypothetical protein